MTFRLIEKPQFIDSTGNGSDLERVYHYSAVGSTIESYVRLQASYLTTAKISTIFGELYRGPIVTHQTAYDQWDVDVTYNSTSREKGSWTWDFDTTGGTVHISSSKATIAKYPTASAPDYETAIDVQGDEVKGTDIVIPAMRFNIDYSHPYGIVTTNFTKYLHDITGKVNSTPFLHWAPGEVLFLGARGSDGTEVDAKVSYSFAMSRNQTNFTVGAVTGVTKYGWDFAWIRFKDEPKTVGGVTYGVKVPEFVFVERVYDTADLKALLGFG